jgi:hypothetical protein
MISTKSDKRKCLMCKQEKDRKAFIGYREICRLCWYYLPEEDKRKYITKSQLDSKYIFNKMAWEKEKLLLKPRLNFKIL